jgi:hypothetical protein
LEGAVFLEVVDGEFAFGAGEKLHGQAGEGDGFLRVEIADPDLVAGGLRGGGDVVGEGVGAVVVRGVVPREAGGLREVPVAVGRAAACRRESDTREAMGDGLEVALGHLLVGGAAAGIAAAEGEVQVAALVFELRDVGDGGVHLVAPARGVLDAGVGVGGGQGGEGGDGGIGRDLRGVHEERGLAEVGAVVEIRGGGAQGEGEVGGKFVVGGEGEGAAVGELGRIAERDLREDGAAAGEVVRVGMGDAGLLGADGVAGEAELDAEAALEGVGIGEDEAGRIL